MTKPSLGILKFHLIDTRQSFIIFWSILILTLAAGIFIGFMFENVMLFYATSFAIYIYAGFAGFLTLKHSFSNIIGLGMTRKDFFLYTTVSFIVVSAIMALTHNLIFWFFNVIKKWLAIEDVTLFHVTMIGNITDSWGMRFFIDFAISFFIMAFFLFVASLYFRYGLVVVCLFAAALVTFFLVWGTTDYLMDVMLRLTGSDAFLYYLLIIGISLIFSFLCWVVMRRSSVEQKIV